MDQETTLMKELDLVQGSTLGRGVALGSGDINWIPPKPVMAAPRGNVRRLGGGEAENSC